MDLGVVTMEACRICREVDAPSGRVADDGLCPTCRMLFRWFLDQYAGVEFRPEGWITPETTFHELSIESLDYVEWLLEAEEQFGVTISKPDGERMIAIRDYLRYIRQNGSSKGLKSKSGSRDPLWDPMLDG